MDKVNIVKEMSTHIILCLELENLKGDAQTLLTYLNGVHQTDPH